MRDDLNCPKSAYTMRPYLDILEFRYNISKDEVLYQNYVDGNCTWMGARTASICRESLNVKPQVLTDIIDDCHLESSEMGDITLSKRLV